MTRSRRKTTIGALLCALLCVLTIATGFYSEAGERLFRNRNHKHNPVLETLHEDLVSTLEAPHQAEVPATSIGTVQPPSVAEFLPVTEDSTSPTLAPRTIAPPRAPPLSSSQNS